MILSVALAAALAPVSFKGGTPNDFAQVLFGAVKQPVMVLSMDPVPAFTFETGDVSTMARQIRTGGALTQASGVQLAYSQALWPRDRIQLQPIFGQQAPWWTGAEDVSKAVSNGKVTLKTTGKNALTREALAAMKFAKPLNIHWTFDRFGMAVQAEDMPERDFLQMIGKAGGYRFIQVRDTYSLEFDPAEFRIRALNSIKKYATPSALEKVRAEDRWALEMATLALQLAPNQGLSQMFAADGGTYTILLDPSGRQQLYGKLSQIALEARRLGPQARDSQVVTGPGESRNRRGEASFATIPRFVQSVDWRQDMALTFSTNFRVRVQAYQVVDRTLNPNRPSPIITIQF